MEDVSEIWVSVRLTIELASITRDPLDTWYAAGVVARLARSKSMWSEAVATIIVVPPMLPQPVLGFYLLALLGPTGPGGLLASLWGERTLAFTFAGLVIGSVLSALPVGVQPIRNAFTIMGDRWKLRPLCARRRHMPSLRSHYLWHDRLSSPPPCSALRIRSPHSGSC